MKPATISSFLGVRNVAQSRKQPLGALAEAVNVDVDDEGVIVSRLGYAKSLALTSVTAAFAPVNADVAYVVDNGTLKQITPGLQSISLGSVSTKDTHWLEIGMRIFMSTGYLIDNGELKAWFIDPPNPPLIQITSGNLPAGQYQITFTTLADDGRESPSCAVSTLNLSADSGLQLSGVDQCNVYLSDANGSNLYYVGYEVDYIGNMDASTPIDPSLMLTSYPEGDLGPIAFYDACVYVSQYDPVLAVSTIYASKPFFWHVFDVFEDYIQVPGEVRMLYGYSEGLLIGTDRDIWAYNGEAISKLAKYGVPPGHGLAADKDGTVMFQTYRGICTLPFKNLTIDKAIFPAGNYCSTAIVNDRAFDKFIILTDGTGESELSTV